MLPKAERMKLFLERASGNLGGLPIFSGAVTLPLIPVGRRTASGRQGRGRKVRTPEGAMPRNFATVTAKEFESDTPGSQYSSMSGIVQFLTNEKGRKTAVVLGTDDYEKLLEDMDD